MDIDYKLKKGNPNNFDGSFSAYFSMKGVDFDVYFFGCDRYRAFGDGLNYPQDILTSIKDFQHKKLHQRFLVTSGHKLKDQKLFDRIPGDVIKIINVDFKEGEFQGQGPIEFANFVSSNFNYLYFRNYTGHENFKECNKRNLAKIVEDNIRVLKKYFEGIEGDNYICHRDNLLEVLGSFGFEGDVKGIEKAITYDEEKMWNMLGPYIFKYESFSNDDKNEMNVAQSMIEYGVERSRGIEVIREKDFLDFITQESEEHGEVSSFRISSKFDPDETLTEGINILLDDFVLKERIIRTGNGNYVVNN